VGCDSQNHKSKKLTKFSVAIAVHRVGMGGIYFYRTFDKKIIPSIKQRLFEEASYGIEVALEILDFIEKNKIDISLEFHLDVNVNAKTESNKVANEIINYVHACGIEKVYPKPAGVTASSIADRHSK
jgi:predicted RNase H-related nuclease YkuK (DUF458 family)